MIQLAHMAMCARSGDRRLSWKRRLFGYSDILWKCRWIESSISETSIGDKDITEISITHFPTKEMPDLKEKKRLIMTDTI
jgi:hypothetical protein